MEDFGPSIALKTPNPPKLPRSAGKERERADGEKQRGMTEFRNVRPMSGKKARGTAFIPAELLSIYKTTIESMQHTINAEVFDRTYSPTKYDEKKNRSPDPFGVPKLPKPRTMGLVGVKDSEDLRQELFCTRDELNAVKQEKKLLLSRIHAIERSHDDMERRYQDQLIASTALRKQRYGGGGEKDPLLDDKLKGALKNSEKQIKQKELEIEELKQSTRYRSLQKFEEEINRYYLEVVRLKRLLEHQETGTRLLDDDPERLLSYDDAISELCVKLTAEQDLNKELSDHNDRITTENERHRMNIDSLTCQLVELNGRHDELVSQHGLLVDSHNELNDKHQTLQNKFENKMMELEDTKKALSDLEERHREATIKIDGLEYLEAKHRENIETLSTQLKQTLESKSGIEAEFEHQKAGDRKKMEKLEEELKTFQDMAENLQHAIEKQEKAHTYQITEKDEALEREHATLASVRADLINLQQQSFDLQNVNVKLNYEISAARDRVSFLEKALLERNEQNRALENEVSQQKGMCKSFESQLAERNDKMGNLERRIATSEIEAKEIKTREAFLQQRVSSLVNDQIENHKKISDLQIELGGHGQEVNILQQALSSTDERLKTKQIEIQKYSENLQALHDSLTEHHERNVFLENAVSALDAQLAEKHGHVMQAQKIISSLEVRLSSVAANASHPVQFSENARSFSSYIRNSYRNITGSE
ncbi:hypothetical protein BC830DRAFT_372034 [Chytriomyces sp. MP71]|nr:hypothetical protein BC830DRAFT_372034 [Chytriomyces sp. MP71]